MIEYKLGANRSPRDERLFRLAKYVNPVQLANPPPTIDWSIPGYAWGVLGNDAHGDCTCATVGHIIQTWDGNTGRDPAAIVTDAHVLDLYARVNGGSDNGADPQTVLNEWRQNGLDSDKCLAFAALAPDFDTPVTPESIKAAIWLFGSAYLAIELPISAQGQDVWDVVDPDGGVWGGHAVNAIAYDDAGVTIVTWGATKKVTWAFLAKYLFEAYAVIDVDWLKGDTNFDPNGNDLAQLQADLAALTPPPAPPVPDPTPTPAPAAFRAKRWNPSGRDE